MLYTQPTGHLAAVSLTLNDDSQLFGLADGFTLVPAGTHRIFPYNLGGATFSTSSTEVPSVGKFSYNGFVLAETDVIRDDVFAKLGDIQSSVRLKIVDMQSTTTLFHATLWGYRLSGITFSAQIMGNATIITGQFLATFRSHTSLPF